MLKPIVQDRILFPEILWQRPLNIYQKRGRVFVLGGEKDIQKTILFCDALYQTKIKKITLGYPDALKNLYQKILPAEFHFPLPSSPLKTLDFSAYQKIKDEIKNYDLLVLGIGLSQNQETQTLIEKLSKLSISIFLNKEGIFKLKEINHIHSGILLLDINLIAHILKKQEREVKENPLLNLENLISEFKKIFILTNSSVFIGKPKTIVITPFKVKEEVLSALVCSLWSQNLKKPFESACVASYITMVWQKNFNKIADLFRALEWVEQEGERK